MFLKQCLVLVCVYFIVIGATDEIRSTNETGKEKIVNGTETDIEKHPHQVYLRTKGSSFFCGGSIISKSHILTAAHCVIETSADKIEIVAGATYTYEEGSVRDIKKIYVHPQYQAHINDYDAAILLLEKQLSFSTKIKLINLPEDDESLREGTRVITTGWGKTENGTTSEVLRQIELRIYSRGDCTMKYSNYWITPRMICAAATDFNADACQGDSGGPLSHNNKLYGITSWGNEECKYFPGVYTRVSVLRDWIRSVTESFGNLLD